MLEYVKPISGNPESLNAYSAWCEQQRKDCLESDHQWRIMEWQEAYPASSGKACKHCHLVKLGW